MKYEPKTTPMERKIMLQMQQELFPGPDVEVVRNVLIDLHHCEACLAAALAERNELKCLHYSGNESAEVYELRADIDAITKERDAAVKEVERLKDIMLRMLRSVTESKAQSILAPIDEAGKVN
jgi:hypothetical protein